MAGSKRLGKGLGALIPDVAEEVPSQSRERLRDVEVSRVTPNPFQPRETFEQQALDELKQSIAENGVIQPITVRVVEDTYQLIAGERRLRAVQELGVEFIPAYVLDVQSDEQMIELSLIENIQRENLNAVDEANGYRTLIERCNLTQEEVAQKVGKDRSTITNALRILKLPDLIQDSLVKGDISTGHARAFLALESRGDQISLWKKTVRNRYSVRQVEKLAKKDDGGSGKRKQEKQEQAAADPYLAEVEGKLQSALGTRVRIESARSGKGGRIEIEYYTDDDVSRIIDVILGD